MAEKITFTQQRIERLPIPEKGRAEYYDIEKTRLVCRVSSTGSKSFVVLKWDGKTAKRVTIGKFPAITVKEARDQHDQILSAMAKGADPVEEKRKQRFRGITLQELLERYLKDKSDLRPASILDYKKFIREGFQDWLEKPINTITRDMVLARRNKLVGGRQQKLVALRAIMNYAVNTLGTIDENPVNVIKDGGLWAKPKRKKRLIPSDGLKGWYQAVLGLENEKAKVYLLLLLHTGLRDQDVRYLEWKDVDFKNGCFIARDTKNHSDFTAYIPPQIKPYFRNLQTITGEGRYVFPGGGKDGVMDIPRKPIKAVIKETGIEFSSHDLKRTFLTIGESAMIPFSLLKALANHVTDSDVTGGYIHTEAKTRKAATLKIADEIQRLTLEEGVEPLAARA